MTNKQQLALIEVCNSNDVYILPQLAATILALDPNTIRCQAHKAPEKLGFPVIVTGTRIRIPRKPFLQFLGEEG